jgi:hypothetical protein
MMMTINFGAGKRDDSEDEKTKEIKKAALARRMQGMKKPKDNEEEELKASSFGGK